MGPKETYQTFFPEKAFLERMKRPVPRWAQEQLESDFASFAPITEEKVEALFYQIQRFVPNEECCAHYRILDNELYKYAIKPYGSASRDTMIEKALKTLLCHVSLPELDFIVVPMDGVPEEHLPDHFYRAEVWEKQVPILAHAKKREPFTKGVVLIPDQITLSESWYNIAKEIEVLRDQVPWKKKQGKAIWRGGTSDVKIDNRTTASLPNTPRFRICLLSKQYPEKVDAGFYTADSPELFKLTEEAGMLTSFTSKKAHLDCRYLPALDGHMCTYPGLHWRLMSDSLTLKQDSDQIQWFYRALKPYEHYLPVQKDLSDLLEKIHWAELHEEACLKMTHQARVFVEENLAYEECYRYLYLVFQKYAGLQDISFVKLKEKTKQDPHWINIQYRKRAELIRRLHRKKETLLNIFKLQ